MAATLSFSSNVGASVAQSQLRQLSRALTQSIKALSSGLRLTSSSVDPAGMALGESLRGQLRGFQQALRNGSDAVSMLQVGEAGYQSISDTLVRMRELAVESSNDSLTNTERGFLDTEFQALSDEVDRIANSTEFNNRFLLNTATTLTYQVGIRNTANDRISITTTSNTATALAIADDSIGTQANANTAITALDTAMDTLNDNRTDFGAAIERLNLAVDHLTSTVESYTAAVSGVRDADMAAEAASFASLQVRQQGAVAILAQANQQPSLVLRLLG
jgi:flagellin